MMGRKQLEGRSALDKYRKRIVDRSNVTAFAKMVNSDKSVHPDERDRLKVVKALYEKAFPKIKGVMRRKYAALKVALDDIIITTNYAKSLNSHHAAIRGAHKALFAEIDAAQKGMLKFPLRPIELHQRFGAHSPRWELPIGSILFSIHGTRLIPTAEFNKRLDQLDSMLIRMIRKVASPTNKKKINALTTIKRDKNAAWKTLHRAVQGGMTRWRGPRKVSPNISNPVNWSGSGVPLEKASRQSVTSYRSSSSGSPSPRGSPVRMSMNIVPWKKGRSASPPRSPRSSPPKRRRF